MKTYPVLFIIIVLASPVVIRTAAMQVPPQRGLSAAAVRARAQIQTTVVPSLTGMTPDQAAGALRERHLTVGTVSDLQSDRPKGTVVNQNPESDKTVVWGTKVDIGLAVPIEVRKMPVPNVIGKDLGEARATLEKAQLRAGPVLPRPSTAAAGQVLSQSIRPDTGVPIGTSVGLTVAEQITVPVPNLVGMSVDEASGTLAKLQLGLGETSFEEHDGAAGVVLAQNISEGSPVPVGTRIGLTISQTATPVEVAVPDVVGKSRDEAAKILTQTGFQVGNVRGEPSTQPADAVLSQTPSAGTPLLPNSPVDLVTAVTLLTVPEVVGLTHADARGVLEQAGFSQGNVSTRFSLFSSEGAVLEQTPSAGNQFIASQAVGLVVAKNLPPWTPLPLALLSAASIGTLLYRRAISGPAQTPPVMALRANVEVDRGSSEIHKDDAPGSSFDIVIRTRVDAGTSTVREDVRKEMQ